MNVPSSAHSDWRLVMCGVNHKTTTLEEREPLQIGQDQIARAHAELAGMPGVIEATIVATCNRVEFYFVGDRDTPPFDVVRKFYRDDRHLDITLLHDKFYTRLGKHVAEHLFRVAAGIDSMVLGENQILGQVKEAYSSACAVKAAGKIMHRLFHQAFRLGKQVRSDTEMGRGACSVSSAAIEMLKNTMERDARPTVLFVGVNKMIALAASAFSKLHHQRLLFANRTVGKATNLADKYGANSYPLDQLPQLLSQADIVITCTGSQRPIISSDMVDGLIRDHPEHHLTVMDIAVPRDSEIDNDRHENITVYDLDEVKRFVHSRQQVREAAIPEAEKLVAERLAEFAYWYDHVRHELVYSRLVEDFETIRQEELAALLDTLPEEMRREADDTTRRLVKRLAQVKARATMNGVQTTE